MEFLPSAHGPRPVPPPSSNGACHIPPRPARCHGAVSRWLLLLNTARDSPEYSSWVWGFLAPGGALRPPVATSRTAGGARCCSLATALFLISLSV